MAADPTNANLSDTAARASRLAADLGFAMVGIAPAEASARQDFVRSWLAAGKHGEMHYLANHLEKRLDPAQLLPGAKAVIVVADRYHVPDGEPESAHADAEPHQAEFTIPSHADAERGTSEASGAPHADAETAKPSKRLVSNVVSKVASKGKIARYAWGDDYHKVVKNRLFDLADLLRERHPGHEFKVTVDTAPTLEREHAVRAGLGWIGKHTLLIHPQLGSYLLLGTIVTTLPLTPWAGQTEPTSPAGAAARRRPSAALEGQPESASPASLTIFADKLVTDHCGSCTRCIDACPTQCITPYQVDGHRCISYLTLEHRSLIDEDLQPQMGTWIAGCDVCQEVCPHNRPRKAGLQKSKIQISKFKTPENENGTENQNSVENQNGVGYRFPHADAEPRSGEASGIENQSSTESPSAHADAEPTKEAKRLEAPLLDAYQPRYPAPSIDLLEVLNWTAADRQAAFTKSALKRIKLPMLKRNAIIAAGNLMISDQISEGRKIALLGAITRLALDKNEVAIVRETARQTLDRIT